MRADKRNSVPLDASKAITAQTAVNYVRMRQRKMLLCVLLATTEALRPPAKVVVLDAYTATAGVFGDRDAAWARNRLASVVSKLSGGNAAHITEAELRLNPVAAKPATFDRLVEIVRGPADSLRRQLPATALTPEQQARCGPRYRPPPRTR